MIEFLIEHPIACIIIGVIGLSYFAFFGIADAAKRGDSHRNDHYYDE